MVNAPLTFSHLPIRPAPAALTTLIAQQGRARDLEGRERVWPKGVIDYQICLRWHSPNPDSGPFADQPLSETDPRKRTCWIRSDERPELGRKRTDGFGAEWRR